MTTTIENKDVAEFKDDMATCPENYTQADISSEEWRQVELEGNLKVHIQHPQTLIIRKGGSTHRVIDKEGVVHCYAAPETGKSVIRWKSKEGEPPVKF